MFQFTILPLRSIPHSTRLTWEHNRWMEMNLTVYNESPRSLYCRADVERYFAPSSLGHQTEEYLGYRHGSDVSQNLFIFVAVRPRWSFHFHPISHLDLNPIFSLSLKPNRDIRIDRFGISKSPCSTYLLRSSSFLSVKYRRVDFAVRFLSVRVCGGGF